MCVCVIQSRERRVWVCTLAFFLTNRRSRQIKSSHFSSVQLNQGTPGAMGAGASAQRAGDRELARRSAPRARALLLGPGRHGETPPAQNVFSPDCTGFCSWLPSYSRWGEAEAFTDLSVVMGHTGKGVWRHGQG